jgi:hypothetical protein
MAARLETPLSLASHLNEACQCIWVDRDKLRRHLRAELGDDATVLEARDGLVSGSVVFVGPDDAAVMDRTVGLITRALDSDAFAAQVAAGAPDIARRGWTSSCGVLGFDFHLGGPTPQLIEINTNPGGLLVSLQLALAATAYCDCLAAPLSQLAAASVGLDQLGDRLAAVFSEAWQRARGCEPSPSSTMTRRHSTSTRSSCCTGNCSNAPVGAC